MKAQQYIDLLLEAQKSNIQNVNKNIIDFSNKAVEIFKRNVPLWNNIQIVFDDKIGRGVLGRFKSKTSSSTPIILLSNKNILSAQKEYNISLWEAVETTILHELGHAICELERDVYGYEYLEYGLEEDWVEDFAYQLSDEETIPDDLKEFIKAYKADHK